MNEFMRFVRQNDATRYAMRSFRSTLYIILELRSENCVFPSSLFPSQPQCISRPRRKLLHALEWKKPYGNFLLVR